MMKRRADAAAAAEMERTVARAILQNVMGSPSEGDASLHGVLPQVAADCERDIAVSSTSGEPTPKRDSRQLGSSKPALGPGGGAVFIPTPRERSSAVRTSDPAWASGVRKLAKCATGRAFDPKAARCATARI